MEDPIQLAKVKFNTLFSFFKDLGYNTSEKIGQNEYRIFLNKKSKTGTFDPLLTNKLFEILNLDEMSTLSIDEFINGFLSFEEEIQKNSELFNFKLAQEQEIYDKILKQCRAYQSEKLNAEGFCENAKIYGEISDIDIKRQLEGIKEIIIIILYNEKQVELRFKIGDKNSNELLKKTFEFKPTSRKDHFEFIMKGVNDKDQVFDIGSKVFPLDDINSQEEYLVQIVIPEIDNPNQIAAYINTKIVLYMSDFKYYESLRKKQEKRLKKYMAAAKKASEYLMYVREIYGDLSQMKPELIVDFNNEKLMQRKGAKLNVNFNNMMEAEAPGANYFVEFNNEREIQTRGVPLRVEFNNSKEVLTPVTETETKKYEYKYNYTSNVNLSKINELEKKIQLLEKEKEKITNNLANLPKTNLEQINIKKITETVKYINNQKDISQQDLNTNIPLHSEMASPKELFTTEKVTTEKVTTNNVTTSQAVPILAPQTNSDTNSQIIQTTTTETKTQNILNNQPVNQDNNFDMNSFLKQTTTQTQYQTQGENQTVLPSSQTDNLGSGGYVHEQTTKTTKTTTSTPIYFQGQNISQVEDQNLLHTVNVNQQDFINNFLSGQNATTTTTKTTTINQYGSGEAEGGIGYGTNINGQVSEYQTGGDIFKESTITSKTQTLDPIVNKVLINKSVGKAIIDQTTNKLLVSEKTLPVSYLPEKVNQVIYEDKVTTLPLIRASANSSYNTLQPIVHDLKTYYANETTTGTNGYNFVDNANTNSNGNIISNNYNYSSEYNYSSNENNNNNYNFTGGYDINGSGTNYNNVNFGEYERTDYGNSSGNNWGTTQNTENVNFSFFPSIPDVPLVVNDDKKKFGGGEKILA